MQIDQVGCCWSPCGGDETMEMDSPYSLSDSLPASNIEVSPLVAGPAEPSAANGCGAISGYSESEVASNPTNPSQQMPLPQPPQEASQLQEPSQAKKPESTRPKDSGPVGEVDIQQNVPPENSTQEPQVNPPSSAEEAGNPAPEAVSPTASEAGGGSSSTGSAGFALENEHSSGHQHGQGQPLNPSEMNSIATTVGLPPISQIQERLDSIGGYNQGQSPEQKIIGANIAQATMAKLTVMPPDAFSSELEASKAYGALKVAGMEGDAAAIRQVLQSSGGDAGELNDEQLVDLWGTNEHQNLHAVLFGNPKVYNVVHITSLNDKDQWQEDGGVDPSVPMGGYNDKGEYPQWGWFEDAKGYNQLFSSPLGTIH